MFLGPHKMKMSHYFLVFDTLWNLGFFWFPKTPPPNFELFPTEIFENQTKHPVLGHLWGQLYSKIFVKLSFCLSWNINFIFFKKNTILTKINFYLWTLIWDMLISGIISSKIKRFNGYSIKIYLFKTRKFLVRPVISWYRPGIRPYLLGVTSKLQNIETRNRNQKPGSLKWWDPGTETRYLIPGRYLVKAW